MMTEKSISEFLSDEYKEFAMYVVEGRAIPSVIDGFKPTQRKIIHVSNQIWKNGSEKALKVFQLAGKVASDAFSVCNSLDFTKDSPPRGFFDPGLRSYKMY